MVNDNKQNISIFAKYFKCIHFRIINNNRTYFCCCIIQWNGIILRGTRTNQIGLVHRKKNMTYDPMDGNWKRASSERVRQIYTYNHTQIVNTVNSYTDGAFTICLSVCEGMNMRKWKRNNEKAFDCYTILHICVRLPVAYYWKKK